MEKVLTDRRIRKSKVVMDQFLSILRQGRSVGAAADFIGITRETSYNWRKADPEFAVLWDSAIERGTDRLEDVAESRAVDGVLRDVYYQGQVVGQEINYSDGLLQFLLKGRRREKFGDRPEIQDTRPVINITISQDRIQDAEMKVIENV